MRCSLFLAASVAALAPARAEAPFDFDHAPGKLPKTVVPSSYAIDLVPDLDKLTLAGAEHISIDVRAPVDTITLNAAGLTLTSVTLEDGTPPP